MGQKIQLPGRDKREQQRFATDRVILQKMVDEVNMLNLMAQQKRNIKYLRGSWYNQFRCWLLDLDPVFTFVNTAKQYASRGIKGGPDQGPAVTP